MDKLWRFGKILGGVVFVALIGCGPGRGDLSGKVSFEGKPLKIGSVNVLGQDGLPKGAQISPDGTYKVADIQAGTVKIQVTSLDPASTQPAVRIPGSGTTKADSSGWFPIPDHFGDFEKSKLTFELKPGPNTLDIELKK